MATKLRNITDKMAAPCSCVPLPEMNGVYKKKPPSPHDPRQFVETEKHDRRRPPRRPPPSRSSGRRISTWTPPPAAQTTGRVRLRRLGRHLALLEVLPHGIPRQCPRPRRLFRRHRLRPFVLSEASYGWEEPLKGGAFKDTVTEPEAQKVRKVGGVGGTARYLTVKAGVCRATGPK
ncbi:hypothetical protein DFJ73DRAFT_849561 [Zopfochytrium polystomum]|nr:hypothetical protein DFJ73DRAFT_849561 [Zopfochytrium polystomum]